jgi:glyoxylase-like metal-dependent hydrolase (beta-lactamase superfamily II)
LLWKIKIFMPDIIYGELVKIADNAHRITAPNAGVMTGQGTNTYLFGHQEIAVVDPGPAMDEHVDAILAGVKKLGGKITHIIATHTHLDHSPAAKLLLNHVDAVLVGELATDPRAQDASFVPDIRCQHNQLFTSSEYRLRAIHTPGHVANHFCFFEENSGLLIAGDHIMNGSTVVIVPPSGDMGAYIRSLQLLLDYDISHIAPAHGDLMDDPSQVVKGLVAHRLGREAKVVKAMQGLALSTIEDLVPLVYEDVDASLYPVAYFSLWAHLRKLEEDNLVVEQAEKWQLS